MYARTSLIIVSGTTMYAGTSLIIVSGRRLAPVLRQKMSYGGFRAEIHGVEEDKRDDHGMRSHET